MPTEADPGGALTNPGTMAGLIAGATALIIAIGNQYTKWREGKEKTEETMVNGLKKMNDDLAKALDASKAETRDAFARMDTMRREFDGVIQDLRDRITDQVAQNNALKVYIAKNGLPDPPAWVSQNDSSLFRSLGPAKEKSP